MKYLTQMKLSRKNGGAYQCTSSAVHEILLMNPSNIYVINLQKWESLQIKKKSEVIPIYKNGYKHLITIYRPISLISNIAKSLKKCLKIEVNFVGSFYIIDQKIWFQ